MNNIYIMCAYVSRTRNTFLWADTPNSAHTTTDQSRSSAASVNKSSGLRRSKALLVSDSTKSDAFSTLWGWYVKTVWLWKGYVMVIKLSEFSKYLILCPFIWNIYMMICILYGFPCEMDFSHQESRVACDVGGIRRRLVKNPFHMENHTKCIF